MRDWLKLKPAGLKTEFNVYFKSLTSEGLKVSNMVRLTLPADADINLIALPHSCEGYGASL